MRVKNISAAKDKEQPHGEYVFKVSYDEWRAHLMESGLAFVWYKCNTYDTHNIMNYQQVLSVYKISHHLWHGITFVSLTVAPSLFRLPAGGDVTTLWREFVGFLCHGYPFGKHMFIIDLLSMKAWKTRIRLRGAGKMVIHYPLETTIKKKLPEYTNTIIFNSSVDKYLYPF